QILAHYGVFLTPSKVSARIRNLKIKFGDDLSCLFQNVESAKTILPHLERKDATHAVSADAAKQSTFAASESVESELMRELRFALVRFKCCPVPQLPVKRPLRYSASATNSSFIPSDVDYSKIIEESHTIFQAAPGLSRAPRSEPKHFAMDPRKSEAGLLSQIAALRN
ncbi:hypothetical protein HZS_7259, partial [Henneguya salminicola]